MVPPSLTRRQQEIYEYLREHLDDFPHPPTLDELCDALGLSSRGSLHKQIQALIEAGLVEPMNNLRRGIRLAEHEPAAEDVPDDMGLPLYGYIAAGQPIAAIRNPEMIEVPPQLRTNNPCYVLEVRGDSMVDDGILDGDWVVIEHRAQARNGEIVVALVDGEEATLKRLEKGTREIILHPANAQLQPMHFAPERVQIQGVLVGQMRRYH
ncbi:MAG: transcriptional repressor LexA [Gammaproteobacteria bacterium]|nr:transcriptional repressor LexA [Gammaproteobacteria bacterium]